MKVFLWVRGPGLWVGGDESREFVFFKVGVVFEVEDGDLGVGLRKGALKVVVGEVKDGEEFHCSLEKFGVVEVGEGLDVVLVERESNEGREGLNVVSVFVHRQEVAFCKRSI